MPPQYSDYAILGNGAFGKSSIRLSCSLGFVFRATDKNTGEIVAIKRSQKMGNKVSREYQMLKALIGAPNVIQMRNFFYSVDANYRIIQNTVLEFSDSNFDDLIKQHLKGKQKIPIAMVKRLMKEFLTGLNYMHKMGICHRDLKPENVLLKKGEVKICDMGSAKYLDL